MPKLIKLLICDDSKLLLHPLSTHNTYSSPYLWTIPFEHSARLYIALAILHQPALAIRYQLGLKDLKLVTSVSTSRAGSNAGGLRKLALFHLMPFILHMILRTLSLCASTLRIPTALSLLCRDRIYASFSWGFSPNAMLRFG
jgi:hypothetical protein